MISPTSNGVVALWLLLSIPSAAHAWCLGKNCVTDDSVCDLGNNTTRRIGAKTFVWARAPREIEIYTRLTTKEILDNCAYGQQLILHSDGALSFDRPILSEVAKSFCRVADIVTVPTPGPSGATGGFESKCVISKWDEARHTYLEREAKISTAQMLKEDNEPPVRTSAPPADIGATRRDSSPECGKWTLGAIFGLPGPCAGGK